MFLSLVFLAELVAGISGFVFRHEVSISGLWVKMEACRWTAFAEVSLDSGIISGKPSSVVPYVFTWYNCFTWQQDGIVKKQTAITPNQKI